MLPVLQIGPLALPTAPLLLLASFWLGLELAERQARFFGADPSALYNATFMALVAGILGARLGYAARAPEAFLQSPLSLLALTPQMLDPLFGIAAASLAALVYIRIKKIALWPVLDAAVSLLAVLGVALGLAHFASGEAFGAPAELPWAIELWGARRHPAQVYETLAALLVAAAVWPRDPAGRPWRARPGLRFWVFVALSAGARLLLESFRGDSALWLNTFRAAQAAAWLALALSLWQIGRQLAAFDSAIEKGVERGPAG
jgi:prolipoprotein diacylglyceryltransferase